MVAEAIGEQCGFDDALKMRMHCARFYFARTRREIMRDTIRGCWVLPGEPPRKVDWRAKYLGEERGMTENHDGDPYQWITCPWCDGDLEEVPIRALGDPTSDGE